MELVPPEFDPLALAYQRLRAAHSVLSGLISSSEHFEYLQAKKALKQLEKEIRELDRTLTRFGQLLLSRQGNIRVVNFREPVIEPLRRTEARQRRRRDDECQGQFGF